MAIVSVIALLVALGVAALLSLQPWAANPVGPRLSVAPGLGIALGDSVAVSPGRQLAVVPARPTGGAEGGLAAGKVTAGEGTSGPTLGVAQARPVTRQGAGHLPQGSPEPPQSEPLRPPPSAPEPVAVPVAAPAPAPSPEPATAPPTRAATGYGGSPPSTSTVGPGVIGGGGASTAIQIHEGDEYAFSFSFYIEPTVYLSPRSENTIMQFSGATGEPPSFGLQLWDDGSGSQRGLWSSGEAMGGERFLAPVAEGVWHEAVVSFRASSEGDGLYLLILDGEPIDARAWISLIESESSSALVETGLFREGEPVADASDIFFGPARLGETLGSVIP